MSISNCFCNSARQSFGFATKIRAAAIVAGLLGSFPAMATAIWTFTDRSDAGDPIGLGSSLAFSQSSGNILSSNILDLSGDGKVDYVTFSFTGNDPSVTWDLTFGTSSFLNSNPGFLSTGIYKDAQKAAFADAGHPGLDFSLNGIAGSTLTGQFTITDAVFASTATGFEVTSFAATFEQHAEGLAAGLTGDFKFVASGDPPPPPPPMPIPGTIYLLGAGLGAWWKTRGWKS